MLQLIKPTCQPHPLDLTHPMPPCQKCSPVCIGDSAPPGQYPAGCASFMTRSSGTAAVRRLRAASAGEMRPMACIMIWDAWRRAGGGMRCTAATPRLG